MSRIPPRSEFLEAMKYLIEERLPIFINIGINKSGYGHYLRIEHYHKLFLIYEWGMFYYDALGLATSPMWYFDIANPEFDPEDIIRYIKKNL